MVMVGAPALWAAPKTVSPDWSTRHKSLRSTAKMPELLFSTMYPMRMRFGRERVFNRSLPVEMKEPATTLTFGKETVTRSGLDWIRTSVRVNMDGSVKSVRPVLTNTLMVPPIVAKFPNPDALTKAPLPLM